MNIAVWYHCKLSGIGIPDEDYSLSILHEQMNALKESGLAEAMDEMHIGVNGDEGQGLLAAAFAPAKAIIHAHGAKAVTELPTFAILRRWLPGHLDWFVLYHHSKGVTQIEHGRHDPEYKAHQRRTMERGVVWNWKQCVQDLERGYDAVGTNWVDPITRPVLPGRFFAGNFWWARADYLAQLPPLPETAKAYTMAEREQAEHWIGSSRRRPMVLDYERPHLSAWCASHITKES